MAWAPDYITAAVLKDYLDIDDTADDVFIGLWITTVSRNVDDHCARQFGQVDGAEERSYTPVYDNRELCWYTEIDDVRDVTGFTIVDDAGAAVTDYTLLPRNAAQRGRPYEQLKTSAGGELTISAVWGWDAVPASVSSAMLLQAARLNARRNSPFGIAGSPSEGSELRLLAQLDPDFRTSLKPYVRRWWAT